MLFMENLRRVTLIGRFPKLMKSLSLLPIYYRICEDEQHTHKFILYHLVTSNIGREILRFCSLKISEGKHCGRFPPRLINGGLLTCCLSTKKVAIWMCNIHLNLTLTIP